MVKRFGETTTAPRLCQVLVALFRLSEKHPSNNAVQATLYSGGTVATHIQYEDDIYYLARLAGSVKAGVTLDIDAEYFRDKIIEDILFLDKSLSRLFSSLKHNAVILKREQYLKGVLRVKRLYDELLNTFLASNGNLSQSLAEYRSHLSVCMQANQDDIQEITSLLDTAPSDESEKYLVSRAEFMGLLESEMQQDE
jgi:hypothetical protein